MTPPLALYGAVWPRGKGAKSRKQSRATSTGRDVPVGGRHFGD